jgi:hypothetical protein
LYSWLFSSHHGSSATFASPPAAAAAAARLPGATGLCNRHKQQATGKPEGMCIEDVEGKGQMCHSFCTSAVYTSAGGRMTLLFCLLICKKAFF